MSILDIFKKKIDKNTAEKKHIELYKVNRESVDLMRSYRELPFNFDNLPYVVQENNNNEKIYLFSGENKAKGTSIILSLNSFIDEAKKSCSSVGPNRIKESDLEFNPVFIEANYSFDYFRVNPKTATGKQTKFPMSIHFSHDICKESFDNNSIFGDIYLLKNGDIGKAIINQWYKKCRHSIILSYKNNRTIFLRIEK